MSRQQKSSLASGTETRSSRLAQLEVQREAVANSHVADDQPDEPLATLTDMETGEVVLEFDGGDTEADAADDAASDAAADAMEEEADRAMAAENGRLWTENDAPRLTDEELGIQQQPITPVQFPTRRDYTLVVQALQFRKAELEKLAKKNAEAGYPREGRIQHADAAAIGEVILPEFKPQIELALVSPQQLQYGIKNNLRAVVHRAITKAAQAGDVKADVAEAESILIDQLAIRVGRFAREVSERSFAAGVSFRESDPESLAEKALDALTTVGEG